MIRLGELHLRFALYSLQRSKGLSLSGGKIAFQAVEEKEIPALRADIETLQSFIQPIMGHSDFCARGMRLNRPDDICANPLVRCLDFWVQQIGLCTFPDNLVSSFVIVWGCSAKRFLGLSEPNREMVAFKGNLVAPPQFDLASKRIVDLFGVALGSAAIIISLQWVGQPGYADTITAYGIITRVMTFVFLPLLGLSFAMQTITGNNYGANLWSRSDASLKMALGIALLYCAAMQAVLMIPPGQIARAFVDSEPVISEVTRILPVLTIAFFLAGPLMMVATYFQAIGSAAKAAVLGLSKTYLFAIPLTFLLPIWFGESGIWFAGPIAEVALLVLTFGVLLTTAKRKGCIPLTYGKAKPIYNA
ncbi:multidrug efflux pump VmrA [Octadecabacter ascidiaceicola]|uniref:Multidrug efflux pump VmrA n=2 Tax=Octadecabacter ascidiaceicola TaxID=1655543 RepID=A0A238K3X0_9RHOB|nr:multidrug efflux pump VmrA [Octadecabacter ascidiaceicola]